MELRIPLSDLDYGPEEEQAVLDVVRRRWLTMGAVTQEFEDEFSKFLASSMPSRCRMARRPCTWRASRSGSGGATRSLSLR